PHSRGRKIRPGFAKSCPSHEVRAQGMPGAKRTRSLARKKTKAYEHSHYRFAETNRHSLRNGFDGCSAALPGGPDLLASVARAIVCASLTPASGGRDHTA